MIKGINGNTYLDMESYLDMAAFEKMQPEILAGFAKAREYAKEGTWMKPGFTFDNMSYKLSWKPIYQAMDEFMELPKDDPIYQGGMSLIPKDFKNFQECSTNIVIFYSFETILTTSHACNDCY